MMSVQDCFREWYWTFCSTLLKNKSNKEMMISFGWLELNANIDDETKMNRYYSDDSTGFQYSGLAALTCGGFAKDP